MKPSRAFAAALAFAACLACKSESEAAPAAPVAAPSTAGVPVHDAMETLSHAGVEDLLDAWSQAPQPDGGKLREAVALTQTTLASIDWTTWKKREKNPADFDATAADARKLADALAAVAAGDDAAAKVERAKALISRCFDCHINYK